MLYSPEHRQDGDPIDGWPSAPDPEPASPSEIAEARGFNDRCADKPYENPYRHGSLNGDAYRHGWFLADRLSEQWGEGE